MIFIPSALGRAVPINDRGLQYEDRILKILYDFNDGPIGADQPFLDSEALSIYSRLSVEELQDPLSSLLRKRLIEEDVQVPGTAYRISNEGLAFILALKRVA